MLETALNPWRIQLRLGSVAGCAEHSDEEEKAYVGNSSESLADSATSGFRSWMRRAFRRGRKNAWFRAESLKETNVPSKKTSA